ELAPEAAPLDAAHRRARRSVEPLVHPDDAGVEPPRDPVGAGEVRRPDAGPEPVLGRVRSCDRVVLVAPALDHRNGAEDPLAGDGPPALRVGEDRRGDEVAARELSGKLESLASEPELHALGPGLLDVRDNAIAMRGGDKRADLRLRVERMSDDDRSSGFGEPVEERVVDVL